MARRRALRRHENNRYYAEFRGEVKGTRAGDRVQGLVQRREAARLVARARCRRATAFTYTVKQDTNAKVLVLANEDYTGVNPEPTPPGPPLKYGQAHLDAVRAAGYSADLWDVDADGVPHDLGVLSHYKAIVWYLGDNRHTQDPEDVITETPLGDLPELAVAERQQYLTMAVRDFLNEGGKPDTPLRPRSTGLPGDRGRRRWCSTTLPQR